MLPDLGQNTVEYTLTVRDMVGHQYNSQQSKIVNILRFHFSHRNQMLSMQSILEASHDTTLLLQRPSVVHPKLNLKDAHDHLVSALRFAGRSRTDPITTRRQPQRPVF